MGREKARLRLGPKTMLGQIRANARKTGWPVRIIRKDLVSRCGPLGGVYTALKTTQNDAVLFLACDMPFVGTEALKCLLDAYGSARQAVFTGYRARVGFPFMLPQRALAAVASQIDHEEFSLQALARVLRAKTIQLPGGSAQLRNVNTPAEWETARRIWNKRKRNA